MPWSAPGRRGRRLRSPRVRIKLLRSLAVNRKFRKQIKGDRFAQEVGATVSWVDHHKELLVRYGAIALGAVLVAGGIYFYIRHQANVREEALSQALLIDNAVIGAEKAVAGTRSYPTQEDKDKAR